MERKDLLTAANPLDATWGKLALKEFFLEYNACKGNQLPTSAMIKYGYRAFDKGVYQGVDRWALTEAMCIAALDCGDAALAKRCLDSFDEAFPNSIRVGILKAKKEEAVEKYSEALKLYKKLLEKEPANIEVMRRIAACYKQQNLIKDAVLHIHKLLAIYPADISSWYELSMIHAHNEEYPQAAHCCEELVMLKPHSVHYHNRLASFYHKEGTFERVELARKHYTISLKYQKPEINPDATKGLLETATLLEIFYERGMGNQNGSKDEVELNQERAVNAQLIEFAMGMLPKKNKTQ